MSSKPRFSNFHITVNTNDPSLGNLESLRNAVENMAEPPYLWIWLHRVHNGSRVPFDEASSQWVDRVRVRAGLENQGEQNAGLHAHILVEVEHHTMVQVDGAGLYAYFREMMPGVRCNINSRFVKGDGEDKAFTLHYLSKERPAVVPKRYKRLNDAFMHGEEL